MSCGHTFMYRGRRGDLNGRFCSMRCQAWHDAGNQPIGRSDPLSVQLRDWKVVAGPPGVEVGSSYYATVFGNRCLTDMRQSGDGFAIKCAADAPRSSRPAVCAVAVSSASGAIRSASRTWRPWPRSVWRRRPSAAVPIQTARTSSRRGGMVGESRRRRGSALIGARGRPKGPFRRGRPSFWRSI
jgi:hypothetical protein